LFGSKGARELNDEQGCKQTKKVKEKKENRVCVRFHQLDQDSTTTTRFASL
jgi:hypothetical protein